jgi:hypothetical protein
VSQAGHARYQTVKSAHFDTPAEGSTTINIVVNFRDRERN